MDAINFSCPKCGNQTFKTVSEVKSYKDFVGAVCINCDTTITESNVEKQYLKISEDATKDAFGKSSIDFDL